MPVDMRRTGAAPTSARRRGTGPGTDPGEPAARVEERPPRRAAPSPRAGFRRSSTSVFQASQPGHWPCHWADWKPHCEQAWTVVRDIPPDYGPAGDAAALVEQHVAPTPVGHLPEPLAHPDEAEAGALVEGDAGLVLGEDPGLERPEAGPLGGLGEGLEQRAADAAAGVRGSHVDADRAHAPVDRARRDRRQGGPPRAPRRPPPWRPRPDSPRACRSRSPSRERAARRSRCRRRCRPRRCALQHPESSAVSGARTICAEPGAPVLRRSAY